MHALKSINNLWFTKLVTFGNDSHNNVVYIQQNLIFLRWFESSFSVIWKLEYNIRAHVLLNLLNSLQKRKQMLECGMSTAAFQNFYR